MSSAPTEARGWAVALGLVVLAAIPLAAGTLRLVQLAGGPAVIPVDHRYVGFPVALVLHIASAAAFALVGALQLVPWFRRRHPGWHRRAGRVLAVAGLVVAGSALWLTLFSPPQPGTGPLLHILRLLFGSATAACLVLGVTAIRRGDIASHRAWMIRGYAIGLAAGTQAITGGLVQAVPGGGVLAFDLAMGSAWAINLAVAQWTIRRAGGVGSPATRLEMVEQPTSSPQGGQ